MKTIISVLSAAVFLAAPLVSYAAVNSINGLNGAAQTLVATTSAASSMHLTITSAGTSHTFSWDNTAWPVKQGGTGWTNFAAGALIFGNGTSALATTSALTYSTSTQTITGGIPGTSEFTIKASAGSGGQGTRLNLYSGDGGTDSSGGGAVVYGGSGNGTGPGGQLELDAGEGGDTGQGGANVISGGGGGVSGGNGGDVIIQSGNAASTIATGGNLAFDARCNAMGENCGHFWFSTGNTLTATTTVNFALYAGDRQHACFNMKDSVTGGDVSFYIANGAMVVENNVCQ